MMTYDDFIKNINNGYIKKFVFAINGYSHYRNCCIERQSNRIYNGKVIESILVNLTNDGTEKVSFFKCFNEDYKLFKISGKSYTLKQVWTNVVVLNVEP